MENPQNLTVRLDRDLIRKAKVIAAQRGTSVSELVARTIAAIVADEESYAAAEGEAIAFLERGFHLGRRKRVSRDELHER
jgi:predicted transcriptional regulator